MRILHPIDYLACIFCDSWIKSVRSLFATVIARFGSRCVVRKVVELWLSPLPQEFGYLSMPHRDEQQKLQRCVRVLVGY